MPSSTPAAETPLRPTSSVRVRIVAAFLAVLAVHLGVVVFLLVQIDRVGRAQALVTEGYLPLSLQIATLRDDQERIERDLTRLHREERRPGTGARSPATVLAERLADNVTEARVHARRAEQLTDDPAELAVVHRAQGQLAAIEELVTEYRADTQTLVRAAEEGRREVPLYDRVTETGRELAEEADRLSSVLDARVRTLNDNARDAATRARALAVALSAATFALAVGALAAVLYALRPIGTLTTHVQELARGERPGRLDVRGSDEISLLAREFDRMADAVEQRDQTLRERADELARLSRYLGNVLDTLAGGLLVVEGGAVTLANPAAARLLGVRVGAAVPDPVRPWVDGDRPTDPVLRLPDGTEHEVRSVPFGDAGVIVWSIDVTDQRRAADRLARSERLALVGQMLAQITHEVRNPLNALSLNAEMLGDELQRLDPERATEAWPLLDTVSGEIDRLTAVTAHYLQLARRPKARLEPEPPSELIVEIARLLRPELEASGVRLVTEVRDLPPVPLDGNLMRQVFLNLVRNAVEAGAREVILRATVTDDELEVAVGDDGAGMSEEDAARAFEPFFSTRPTGTGLGLAVSRQIIEDHGGRIEVQSRDGGGTWFRLHLPRSV